MLFTIFHIVLSQPLINTLVFFYNTIAIEDLGLAIIFLTLLIRVILFPLFQKGTRHQVAMQAIQPKLKEIQEKYKKDRVKQTEETMALYKSHGVNPFSSIGFLIVQIPILIALYRIFLEGLTPEILQSLYSFVSYPDTLNNSLLGLIDLSNRSILIVVLAAAAQYVQGKLSLHFQKTHIPPSKSSSGFSPERMQKMMVTMGPAITLIIFFNLPAAVGLYWLTTSLFSIIQQYIVQKEFTHLTHPTHHGMETIHR